MTRTRFVKCKKCTKTKPRRDLQVEQRGKRGDAPNFMCTQCGMGGKRSRRRKKR